MRTPSSLLRPGAHMLCLLLLSAVLCTCVDEIDLGQAENLPDGIVVRGRVVLDEEAPFAEVALEQLFQFASNLPDLIVSADVELENSDGQRVELIYRDGLYRASLDANDPNFSVRPGLGYRVLVTTVDGSRYGSEFDVMPERVVPENLTTDLTVTTVINPIDGEVEVPALAFRVTTPVRYAGGDPAYLRHTFDRVFALTQSDDEFPINADRIKVCYVPEAISGNRLTILSGREIDTDQVEDYTVLVDPINFKYAQGQVINTYQEAISQGAYLYFDQIASINDRDASIFTNPPGPIIGNVSDLEGATDNVFGYFYAANRATVRTGITPGEVGNPRTYCPPPPTNGPGGYPLVCLDCLNASGSSRTPPEYWPY